jgi:peptidyl-prolyl cis-trans isomerase A (cyclophilin A)
MIQMGDPLGTGHGWPGYEFADEFHPDLRFDQPHVLAMANDGPNTNGGQFFITVTPQTRLNDQFTIFGKVVDELSAKVVDAIANTPTDDNDRPINDVTIERVVIVRD